MQRVTEVSAAGNPEVSSRFQGVKDGVVAMAASLAFASSG